MDYGGFPNCYPLKQNVYDPNKRIMDPKGVDELVIFEPLQVLPLFIVKMKRNRNYPLQFNLLQPQNSPFKNISLQSFPIPQAQAQAQAQASSSTTAPIISVENFKKLSTEGLINYFASHKIPSTDLEVLEMTGYDGKKLLDIPLSEFKSFFSIEISHKIINLIPQ